MTNLKKTLAVVLAFAMMLSMGSAFAYSDVEAGTTVSEAVGILSNLGILTGFEDGTFRPDETVTRAQMAAIICRMLGYEDQAQSSVGTTVFTDVDADHWASGYINVAQAQGIINGMGDGTFAPDAKVTYEQAIKMIVAALGYDLVAARKGGYPTGYLAIASAEGITKKANGKVGDAAARATVAILVYNALEVRLMDQESWTADGSDSYKKSDDTILSKYLEVDKYEATVALTPAVAIAANGYDPENDAVINLVDVKSVSYDKGKLVKPDADDLNGVLCEGIDVDSFLGKTVVAYIAEEDGEDKLVAIAETSKNSSLAISAIQLATDSKIAADENVIAYREVGAKKVKELDLNEDGVTVYVNYEEDGAVASTEDLAALFEDCGGTIEFLSNDGDDKYDIIFVLAYQDEAVIKEVEEEDGIFTFEYYNDDVIPSDIDTEDEDALVVVYKDGELATVADLAANDTVSYIEIGDNFEIFFASSATVTGTVDSYSEEDKYVTIAGEDYDLSAAYDGNIADLNGAEGIFFLNVDGQIAYNDTEDPGADNYALILGAYETTEGFNDGAYLQVVLADGTLAEYKLADKAKFGDAKKSEDVYAAVIEYLTEDGDVYKATVADLQAGDLLVDITISGDKITKIKAVDGEDDKVSDSKKYDADSMTIGGVGFDEETIVFSFNETDADTFVEAEDIVIGTVADFFVDGEKLENGVAYVFDGEKDVYAVALGFGLKKSIDTESDLFIVTGKKITSIDDEPAYILTGYVNGEEAEVTLFNEDGDYGDDEEEISVGDILLFAAADAEDIVSEFAFVVDDGVAKADADANDDVYGVYAKVTDADSNKFFIDKAVVSDDGEDDIAVEDGIAYKTSATYVLVDYSESDDPEVSKKSGSKALFNSRYNAEVYVRFIEGKLVDVIVIRTEK